MELVSERGKNVFCKDSDQNPRISWFSLCIQKLGTDNRRNISHCESPTLRAWLGTGAISEKVPVSLCQGGVESQGQVLPIDFGLQKWNRAASWLCFRTWRENCVTCYFLLYWVWKPAGKMWSWIPFSQTHYCSNFAVILLNNSSQSTARKWISWLPSSFLFRKYNYVFLGLIYSLGGMRQFSTKTFM